MSAVKYLVEYFSFWELEMTILYIGSLFGVLFYLISAISSLFPLFGSHFPTDKIGWKIFSQEPEGESY